MCNPKARECQKNDMGQDFVLIFKTVILQQY